MLKWIYLRKDHEPNSKGNAEIFAIVSGLQRGPNQRHVAHVEVIDMPYLDHDKRSYFPNQVLVNWDDFYYKAVNINLFERDTGTDYKKLAKNLINSATEVLIGAAGGSAGLWALSLNKLANAILDEVGRGGFLSDGNDYVDSFYTIRSDHNYHKLYGARNNASMGFEQVWIPAYQVIN